MIKLTKSSLPAARAVTGAFGRYLLSSNIWKFVSDWTVSTDFWKEQTLQHTSYHFETLQLCIKLVTILEVVLEPCTKPQTSSKAHSRSAKHIKQVYRLRPQSNRATLEQGAKLTDHRGRASTS
jgi:hypothetical protein